VPETSWSDYPNSPFADQPAARHKRASSCSSDTDDDRQQKRAKIQCSPVPGKNLEKNQKRRDRKKRCKQAERMGRLARLKHHPDLEPKYPEGVKPWDPEIINANPWDFLDDPVFPSQQDPVDATCDAPALLASDCAETSEGIRSRASSEETLVEALSDNRIESAPVESSTVTSLPPSLTRRARNPPLNRQEKKTNTAILLPEASEEMERQVTEIILSAEALAREQQPQAFQRKHLAWCVISPSHGLTC